MAMQGSLLDFIWGWMTIPLRVFWELFRNIFPPVETHDSHGHAHGQNGSAVDSSDANGKDTTVDNREMRHWTKLSQHWWDPEGDFALLRGFNNCRIPMIMEAYSKYILKAPLPDQLPLLGARIIDVGCGAGFVSEPLAEYGAHVTGVDMVAEIIQVAQSHWNENHSAREDKGPEYICAPVESLANKRRGDYDMVLCLEVVDHVAKWPEFVGQCCQLLRPGGCAVFSTINRTLASLIVAIIGGEHLFRIVPMDTHHLHKFVKPKELEKELKSHGLTTMKVTGCMPANPWAKRPHWIDVPLTNVCYAIIAIKPEV